VTQLVEDITIKITLNHCEGDSTVLGGDNDLREIVASKFDIALTDWLEARTLEAIWEPAKGVRVVYLNTGLYEAPEVDGGDN
jgi:hypothetical protein